MGFTAQQLVDRRVERVLVVEVALVVLQVCRVGQPAGGRHQLGVEPLAEVISALGTVAVLGVLPAQVFDDLAGERLRLIWAVWAVLGVQKTTSVSFAGSWGGSWASWAAVSVASVCSIMRGSFLG